ncbi:MAG: tetratricopeptide repeat protein [Sporolactobacillus sp.]
MEQLTDSQLFDVDFENADDQLEWTLTFQALGELTSRKLKRHRAVAVQVFLEPAHQLIHVDQQADNRPEYINEEGDLDFVLPMRADRLQLTIPYSVFPELHYGDFVSIRVRLENETTGELLHDTEFTLIATKKGNLDILTNHGMEVYLKSGLPAEERYPKIVYWIEQNADNAALLTKAIALLNELVAGGSLDAAKKIHELYSESRYAVADPQAAATWEKQIIQLKRAALTAREKEEAARHQLPDQITDDAALAKCEQFAQQGNLVAKWLIYRYSLTAQGKGYDKEKAFTFAKEAAEAGLTEAIAALADAYASNYVFVAKEQVKDYLAVLKSAAEKKEPLAEFLIFKIYYYGKCLGENLPIDKKAAYYYLCLSAEGGHVDAAFRIWTFFENGNEFLMEETDALKWLKVAADHGHPAAEARLGDLYIDGKLVSKDDDKGLAFLQKAADKHNWDAQLILYQSYYNGRYKDILFDQDKKKAFNFLEQFASGGNAEASVQIMRSYLKGNEMNLEHREAVNYLRMAVAAHYAPAMYLMADLLLDGLYLPQDLKEAKNLLQEAAASDFAEAQFALYHYYCYGYKSLKNAAINKERAYKWLLKAAQSLPAAQYEVWLLSRDRHYADFEISAEEALDYLFRSAAKNYSPALFRVGMAFGWGEGVEKNTARGIQLIEQAASQNHPEAIFSLSEIRTSGSFGEEAVETNPEQGLHLLLLSAELGFGPACQKVGELYAAGQLADESEKWIRQIVDTAASAGFPVKHDASEAAAAKEKE